MAKKIVTSLNVNMKEFNALKEHEFFIKTSDRTAYKAKPPGILIKPKHYAKSNLNPYLIDPLELKQLKHYLFEESNHYVVEKKRDKKGY